MAHTVLPEFQYEGDMITAVYERRVIASGTDFAKVSCTAEEYFNSLQKERKEKQAEAAKRGATHITTPNGLKGTIISRVASVFGGEITVRFENNEIRRFETLASEDPFKYTT